LFPVFKKAVYRKFSLEEQVNFSGLEPNTYVFIGLNDKLKLSLGVFSKSSSDQHYMTMEEAIEYFTKEEFKDYLIDKEWEHKMPQRPITKEDYHFSCGKQREYIENLLENATGFCPKKSKALASDLRYYNRTYLNL
jgi:hypothetical protein